MLYSQEVCVKSFEYNSGLYITLYFKKCMKMNNLRWYYAAQTPSDVLKLLSFNSAQIALVLTLANCG